MKLATRLKVSAAITAGSTVTALTLGAAATGCRTLAQVIADGTSDTTAIKVSDTGVPFMLDDGAGNWEEAYFTITSSTVITKESIIASSNGGAAVTFPGTTLSVFSTPPGSWLRKVVSTSDGVAMSDLTAAPGTIPDTYVMMMVDPATGIPYKVTVAALKTLFAAAPSETLTVNNPGAQVAGTAFAVSGTYANGTPTALDWSINGGSSWNAAVSPTISSGTFSFTGVSVPSANASQTVMVRDHNAISVMATSASFVVSAAEAITVNTPGTQTVGVAFNVTGGYTNGNPTALDYRLSDDPAGQWTQVASPTISLGSFQFSLTPASTSAGRTISVRDRNNTSAVGTSGTYAVIAAGATVSSVTVTPSAPTVSGGQTQQFTATVAGTNSPSQAVTWSIQSGPGSINSSGLYTAPAATGSQQSAVIKALSTQDGTTFGTATVTIPAATATITVDTPTSPKVVGTAFAVTGTWTITQPTALDYRLSDDAAGTWTQVTATINANGTYTFNITPASTSAGRTISVRDRNNTSVSGTSGSYTVNAAATMAQTYNVNTSNNAGMTGGALTATLSSPDYYAAPSVTRVNIRSNDGNNTVPADNAFKLVWLKKGVTPAQAGVSYSSTQLNADSGNVANGNQAVHQNAIASGNFVHVSTWANSSSSWYGTFSPPSSFYIWAGAAVGTWNLWALFSDGSSKVMVNATTGDAVDYTTS